MTPDEITLTRHLVKAKMQPGSWDKRFARDLCAMSYQEPTPELTANQRTCLLQNVVRYRRSLDPKYVKLAKDLLASDLVGKAVSGNGEDQPASQGGFTHSNHISPLGLPG